MLTLYMENCQKKEAGKDPLYTILIVTHELNEAIYVGDRVIGLSQYWNWQEQNMNRCPGATIVYDRMAPVYKPDETRNYEAFIQQRRTIRHAAFSPEVLQDPGEYHQFWDEIQTGHGKGVLS